jgi:L-asparagine transporter-like permease
VCIVRHIDNTRGPDDDLERMNRILLLGYLILAALVLVFVAMVMEQIRPSDARMLAVTLVLLAVADVALRRRPQRD